MKKFKVKWIIECSGEFEAKDEEEITNRLGGDCSDDEIIYPDRKSEDLIDVEIKEVK